jgi:hypothetical protein
VGKQIWPLIKVAEDLEVKHHAARPFLGALFGHKVGEELVEILDRLKSARGELI